MNHDDLTRQIENAATLTEQALTQLLARTERALADLRAGRRMEQHLDGQLFLANASYHALFHAQRLGTLTDTALAAGVDPEAIFTAAIPA